MNKYQILYEYTYDFCDGYTFKKQICIDDNKRIIFNFIVNDGYCDDFLLSKFNNDFKDNILNIKIKEYMLRQIRGLAYIKTLFLTIRNKGEKAPIEIIKDGIKFDNKVFKLKNNDYQTLQYQLLEYISGLKKQCK